MAKPRKVIKIDNQKYSLVKQMIASKVPKTVIAKALGMSTATLYNISKSDTLDDYRRALRAKKRHQVQAKQPATPPAAPTIADVSTFAAIKQLQAEVSQISKAVNAILEYENGRHEHDKVSKWKFR